MNELRIKSDGLSDRLKPKLRLAKFSFLGTSPLIYSEASLSDGICSLSHADLLHQANNCLRKLLVSLYSSADFGRFVLNLL